MMNKLHRPQRFSPAGFTIIELLVVVGIVVLLVGILTPMVMKSYRNAEIAKTQLNFQAIATALEAYRSDHGEYPQIDPDANELNRGGRQLFRALIASGPAAGAPEGDGADGPGFRLRAQGKVYGPYLVPEKFSFGNPTTPTSTDTSTYTLLDDVRNPFLYFPARVKRPQLTVLDGYVSTGTASLYNSLDNIKDATGPVLWLTQVDMLKLLGDKDANGRIDANERALYTGPFILWSAGIDGAFGTDDDVTNFDRN